MQKLTLHKKQLNSIGLRIGIKKPDHWYQTTTHEVILQGGERILQHYGNSLQTALKNLYPQHPWHPWLFLEPGDIWNLSKNRRDYLDWLGSQLLIDTPDKWYKVSNEQLEMKKGAGLLSKYGNFLYSVLKD